MSSIQSRYLRFLVMAILVLASWPRALAAADGSIQGTVSGPGGQPAAQVQVRISSAQTGLVILLRTDSSGYYAAMDLPPAIDYEIEISDERGLLAPLLQDRIVLRAGQLTWEPFQLHPTIHESIRQGTEPRDRIVKLKEVGSRTIYDHVFLEALPLFQGF